MTFVKRSREDMEKVQDLSKAIETLKTIHDPEVGLDIWNLELIYDLQMKNNMIQVFMTFTSPLCPYGPELVDTVKEKLLAAGFKHVDVEIVIDPPWVPSEYVKELLGLA